MPKRANILFSILLSACASPRAEVPQEKPFSLAPATPEATVGPQGTFADSRAQIVLGQALAVSDFSARLLAVETLGLVADAWAFSELERKLGDPDADIRAAAILALGNRADARARELLLSIRDDETEDLDLRVLAIRTLLTPSLCSRNQP